VRVGAAAARARLPELIGQTFRTPADATGARATPIDAAAAETTGT
jgi:hypothetical protein